MFWDRFLRYPFFPLPKKQKTKDTDILNVEQEMSESFGHKIEIDTKNKNAGRVSILYKTLDELDSIIQKLKNK